GRPRPSALLTRAQQATSERAGVLARLHRHLAVDDGAVVARCALYEAARAPREVVDVLRLGQAHAVEVDDVDVGVRTGSQDAAIGDAEQLGGVGRQAPDRLADGTQLAVANPVGEEERGLAR